MAASTNIYSTGFEASEGYDSTYELIGQKNWAGYGADSGGNGVFTISGHLSAYVGFHPLAPPSEFLSVWQPLPDPTRTYPVVKFSTLMTIEDSTNDQWDNFHWSVYNQAGDRLFTLDFDNYELTVYYSLNGTNGFVFTGVLFTNDVPYTLSLTMDFASNRWSASLSGTPLAANLPITTTNTAPLSLGDIDAVWVVYTTNAPGDNYMAFDDYRVTAEAADAPPPVARLVPLTYPPNGPFALRLLSSSGGRFAIDATTNWTQWTPLKTNTVTDGFFDYIDTQASSLPARFYRGRYVP